MGDLVGANDAYEEGLKLDPANTQNKNGLAAVKRAIEAEAKADSASGFGGAGMGGMGLGGMFNDPQLVQKLAANPKTAPYLADAAFMRKLQSTGTNSDPAAMFSDPRIITAMSVLMGLDADAMSMPDMKDRKGGEEEDVDMPDVRPSSKAQPKKEASPEVEMSNPEDDEAAEKAKAKAAAEEEKKLGTESYKKRSFDEAIAHYTKAWELYKDITYLNNLGAAHFEKKEYEETIKACEKAVEEGREIYADFKMIAKAYARIGSAYEKLGDSDKAIENYKRALTEHRTPDIVTKLRNAENFKIDSARKAYIDPEKAEEARILGNDKFKEADWPGAIEAYSEMIKRAPEDPRGYSNRAAAFIKLLEFPSAVDDCNAAIKRDSSFIRAHLRKAQAYFGMRDYSKCLDTCTEASEVDVGKANAREIEQQQNKALQAMYSARDNETEDQTRERIQKDPEIMSIMQDPVMQSILQQAQNDPAALQEHMKNAGIKSKIQKLIAAGVIRTGR